jgi:hypothetical protein
MDKDKNIQKISLKEFAAQYASDKKLDAKKYCFILGAGASIESGIPSGGTLAKMWIEDLEHRLDANNFMKWKKEIGLEYGREAEKYSKIYDERFKINPIEGYRCLEEIMKEKEPSIGYSVLAQILEKTTDKIVITTNFDNLIEDAMFIYSIIRPKIIVHESLAEHVNLNTQRPLIAKIHRDLLFNPKSNQGDVDSMDVRWKDSLGSILNYYTPIIIGYGGNDGSLMDFLDEHKNPKTGMFWFYVEKAGVPNKAILDLIKGYNGWIIPIIGFDDMMFQLSKELKYPSLADRIEKIAKERKAKYEAKIIELKSNPKTSQETKEITSEFVNESLVAYKEEISRRNEIFPYEKNIFIMMKYRDYNEYLYRYIDDIISRNGFNCVRADMPEWNITNNVYNPIAVLYACKYGIALFDESMNGDNQYSPNVTYELGMIIEQGKDCLILKDKSLDRFPFDLTNQLCYTYKYPEEIEKYIEKWIKNIRENNSQTIK